MVGPPTCRFVDTLERASIRATVIVPILATSRRRAAEKEKPRLPGAEPEQPGCGRTAEPVFGGYRFGRRFVKRTPARVPRNMDRWMALRKSSRPRGTRAD